MPFPTPHGPDRREFCRRATGAALGASLFARAGLAGAEPARAGVTVPDVRDGEDLFAYVRRRCGRFERGLYQQVTGAANEFKEGDQILGVAAADERARRRARALLGRTRVGDIAAHPLFEDDLVRRLLADVDPAAARKVAGMTLGELRAFVLERDEEQVRALVPGLASDAIGCLVKLMSNDDLTALGRRLFFPLPGTRIGAPGYLGARLQPNSPTDHPDDIVWQVFSGWSYGVGDVVLGTNPVNSDPESVAAVEAALGDVIRTFGLEEVLPHCVLAHIDVQAEVEAKHPGTTGIWFQSLAGSTAANATFDVTVPKMLAHAARRAGQYGLYFETGQGADCTNGHGQGTDMVIHEARKYGFVRLLRRAVGEAQRQAGREVAPWVHVNDVAGFIGPEVFRTREQLVRCCLEDIALAKLHGLTIGLDVCSTLHMDVSLEDLDWCLERIAPANPAYLMALPTKNDPMLGYLTTAFQDHVRLRQRFGFRVNDKMGAFFQRLGVLGPDGRPGAKFGQPLAVWLAYRRAKGDMRTEGEIKAEGRRKMKEVRDRGVWLAEGHGEQAWDLTPELRREITDLYHDSKKCIHAELTPAFVKALPKATLLRSTSKDREDYILHPQTGEKLDEASRKVVQGLRRKGEERLALQIIVSDGLNAYAILDEGHLAPYLAALRRELAKRDCAVAEGLLVVHGGRVRTGYQIGELLFAGSGAGAARRGIVHLIGERPGSLHHTFSAYITVLPVSYWSRPGRVDHDVTRVVSGIADTALEPGAAAAASAKIIDALAARDYGDK